MDVPGKRTVHSLVGQVGDVYGEGYAVGAADGLEGSCYRDADERIEHAWGKSGDIGGSRLIGLYGCGAEEAGVAWWRWKGGDDGSLFRVDAREGSAGW